MRDPAALARVLDGWRARHGEVAGLIHGAGLIKDKLIRHKSVESFDRVLETKLDGALNLIRLVRGDSLKFTALFSSIAGRFGNVGQSDYAAANEILNKLAHWLDRRWPGRVVSLIWGPWSGVGMVSQLESHLGSRGLGMISPESGGSLLIERAPLWPQGRRRGDLLGRAGDARAADLGGTGCRSEWRRSHEKRTPLRDRDHRHGLPIPRRIRPDRLFREHRLCGKDCTREVPPDRWNAQSVLRPALAGQRSCSLVPGRIPGFAHPVRRGRARHHAADDRGRRARAVPGAGCDRGRARRCRVDPRFTQRRSRRSRDRPRELLQSWQPDAASARPHDRPDGGGSGRPPSRLVGDRAGCHPGRSSGQPTSIRGGDDSRSTDQCDGRAHRPAA